MATLSFPFFRRTGRHPPDDPADDLDGLYRSQRAFTCRLTTLALTVAVALAFCARAFAAEPQMASVSYTIAPGELGSPTETITVARHGDERSITVMHQEFKQAAQLETERLSPAEFSEVWNIVIRDRLLSFTPSAQLGTAFDYGERKLRIDMQSPSGPPLVRQLQWIQPLENEAQLASLVAILSKLARAHPKTITLTLF